MAADVPSERELIVEPIEPDVTTFRAAAAAQGEPARPTRFSWRGEVHEIASIERAWKTTDATHRAVGDAYVRKHWLDVRTTEGLRLRLYADRGLPQGRKSPRWWLHSRVR